MEIIRIKAVLTKFLDNVVRTIIEKNYGENNDSALSTRIDWHIIKSKIGDYKSRDRSPACELKKTGCYKAGHCMGLCCQKLCKGRVIVLSCC